MENPFKIFEKWYSEQMQLSKANLPAACCFTTIGNDGYPNSRYVSLKEIKEESFVITGPSNSRKGYDIKQYPKVAISFWWRETQRQIRIQGVAAKINETEAKKYFDQRNRASKIVSTVFDQGMPISSLEQLTERYERGRLKYDHSTINKPNKWSGWYIRPARIEFMEFEKTRLHKRTLFEQRADGWERTYLQP